jgi:hypothetical protein
MQAECRLYEIVSVLIPIRHIVGKEAEDLGKRFNTITKTA